MRLSRFTDIGMRALMYVAAHDRRVSTREVAEAYGISKDHVSKSLQALVALEVVESIPGRHGGFLIACDPEVIRVGTLVRGLEPSLAMAECFKPDSHCPLTPSCDLATALQEAQRAFFEALDRYTLADLVRASHPILVQLTYATA